MKVITLSFFFFITNMILLYVIVFTSANYSDILEIKHVSRIWNTFCSYSVVTEYRIIISNVNSSDKFVVLR